LKTVPNTRAKFSFLARKGVLKGIKAKNAGFVHKYELPLLI